MEGYSYSNKNECVTQQCYLQKYILPILICPCTHHNASTIMPLQHQAALHSTVWIALVDLSSPIQWKVIQPRYTHKLVLCALTDKNPFKYFNTIWSQAATGTHNAFLLHKKNTQTHFYTKALPNIGIKWNEEVSSFWCKNFKSVSVFFIQHAFSAIFQDLS